MVLAFALNILAVIWYTISGSIRALFSCGTRSKTPDIASDVCLVTGAGQVSVFVKERSCAVSLLLLSSP